NVLNDLAFEYEASLNSGNLAQAGFFGTEIVVAAHTASMAAQDAMNVLNPEEHHALHEIMHLEHQFLPAIEQGGIEAFLGFFGDNQQHFEGQSVPTSDAEFQDLVTQIEAMREEYIGLGDALADAQTNLDAFFSSGAPAEGFADAQEISHAISYLTMLEGEAIALEGAIAEASDDAARESAEHDLQAFFDVGGPGEHFADSAAISEELVRLYTLQAEALTLEDVVLNAQGEADRFFVDGSGSSFANVEELEQFSAELHQFHIAFVFHDLVHAEFEHATQEFFNDPSSPGYGHTGPGSLLTTLDDLITLEGQARTLVDDLQDAQNQLDSFFGTDGPGAGFTD
ncbi:MAG: hypothetical protein VX978_02125, partial [Pseudomonadota bacterium]|nr:hypothetical protein [Pseudomonadota bacterium]